MAKTKGKLKKVNGLVGRQMIVPIYFSDGFGEPIYIEEFDPTSYDNDTEFARVEVMEVRCYAPKYGQTFDDLEQVN